MDSFNEGSSPRPRHLDLDPFAPLSDDLVAHILALVASNGFCFHPKPRLTAAAVTSGTTTATAAAAAAAIAVSAAVEANADGGDGASAERDDGIAGNVGNAVNVSVNNGDGYARGDASEDELHKCIARAVKTECASCLRVIYLTSAIFSEANATAANYARIMTHPIMDPEDPADPADPADHGTPSAEHILASAYPPPLCGTSADSAPLPPLLPPPPLTVFHHALVCKRRLRLARFSLPAILLQHHRRLSTQTFRSFLSSPPPPSLSPLTPASASASAVSPSFPLHSPLTLQHLHIGPSALDAITDDLLHSIATGCAPSLTHLSLYSHRNLRYWNPNRPPEDPDIAVTKVTEPAFSALFAACRRLVSLKLVVPLCLPELPASVSLLQRLTRLDVSFDRDERDNRPDPEPEPRFPESVGSLSALRSLRIRDTYVRALPHTLSRLRSLTSLKIDGCAALRQLPDGLGHLKSLQHLDLAKLPALESLPHSIGLLSSLETLHLRDVNVDSLPNFSSAHLSSLKRLLLTSLAHLESLPDGIGELPSLQELTIKSCARLAALPASLSALSSLTALTVQHCDSLDSLPEDIGDVPRLASLVLDDLPSLAAISDSLALLSSLMHLHAANCQDLALLPASFAGMQSVSQLHLLGCSLGSLPEDLGQVSGLTELQLSKVAGLHLLPSLLHLDIRDSLSHLQRLHLLRMDFSNLPEDLGQMQGLRVLTIDTLPNLSTLPASLTLLTSLQHLMVSLSDTFSSLPEDGFGNLSSLLNLSLKHLPLLLKLPAAVSRLASLQVLDVEHCENLSELPEGLESVRSLREVYVDGCSQLEDALEPLLARAGTIQVHM
ncbi:unnamed protein product [Closterium sp. Naga37s-1]|nr:unnamed protein product [Closterium sp. Naga37s-1]